jgi:nitrite reductase/ring-hydroxylating ferredoxin subunit
VSEVRICPSAELVDGGKGVRFEVPAYPMVGAGETAPAFAIRFRGRVYAYLNRCTHVPVELDWQPGEFFDYSGLYLICAMHGALYAPESGRCLGGRCDGKGLRKLDVVERDGDVYLLLNEQEV